jgi:hypothetical protein
MDTAGALAGPLLAFAVLAAIPLGLGGYHAVFVLSLAFAVLGLIVLALAAPDLRTGSGKSASADQATRQRMALWLSDLSQPALRRVLAVAGLLGLVTVGDGFIYLSLSEADSVATKYFPLLFVGTNAAYRHLQFPLGRAADRVEGARVFLIGHVVLLVSMPSRPAALAVAPGPWCSYFSCWAASMPQPTECWQRSQSSQCQRRAGRAGSRPHRPWWHRQGSDARSVLACSGS